MKRKMGKSFKKISRSGSEKSRKFVTPDLYVFYDLNFKRDKEKERERRN